MFKIEEELDSGALDTRDDVEIFPRASDKSTASLSPPTTPTKQRLSSFSHSPSNSSLNQRRTRSSSQSRLANHTQVHFANGSSSSSPQSEVQGSQPHPIPRNRVNSMMNRSMEVAQSFTSPLAQLYQPLVVDDELPVNDSPDQSHRPAPASSVSYGPATRRRLSSMQGPNRRTTNDTGGQRQNLNRFSPRSPQDNFPSMQEVMNGADGVVSDSPLGLSPRPGGTDIPTAGEVQEEEGHSGGSLQWAERMEKLEERSERIEKLLETIVKSLEGSNQ